MTDRPMICVIDDDRGFAESLRCLLESEDFEVRLYEGGRAFLDQKGWRGCACLVVDVQMPGMSGLELQDHLVATGNKLPLIVLTGHADVPTAVRALKNGALDFLQKPFADCAFLDAVQRAVEARDGQTLREAERTLTSERYATLTPREQEVLSEMLTGQPNKVIAHRLGVSPRTVEVHRARILQKMGVPNLSRLIRTAIETGIGCQRVENSDARLAPQAHRRRAAPIANRL